MGGVVYGQTAGWSQLATWAACHAQLLQTVFLDSRLLDSKSMAAATLLQAAERCETLRAAREDLVFITNV